MTNETATCIDCGLDVVYNDPGFWPWRGIDGSDICRTQISDMGGEVRAPHRVHRTTAEEIFAAFTERTGQLARHR